MTAAPDEQNPQPRLSASIMAWSLDQKKLSSPMDLSSPPRSIICRAYQVQPLDNVLPNPPQQVDAVQICILTPGGIRHGIGTFAGWAQNPTGAPIVAAATDLMKCLVEKNTAMK